MNYSEALDYIHSVSWTFCKPGLDRIQKLCERLGNPQDELKFIHVAGTNGKGSFSSMISSVLTASGLKVGLYTSPYILEFNERMRVNGKNIPNDTLTRLTEKIRPISDSMEDKPTEFELITAIALDYFREEKVDIVVFECGMGGRLDSTNVISTSLLSVITGISLDHTAFLGDSVEKIAYEKAGIIKEGVPVLFGGEDEAAAVIASEANKKGSRLERANYSDLTVTRSDLESTIFNYRDRTDIEISLSGLYQPRNAALVLDALDLLSEHFPDITERSIREGLKAAKWPARFEIISSDPLVIFDGAHNPEGISSAVKSIAHYFTEKVIAISGVLADKDYTQIAKSISSVASDAFTITPDSNRALSAERYSEVLSSFGVASVHSSSIPDAVNSAVSLAKKSEQPIVCLGSLYTYAEIISALKTIKNTQ